ncbi:CidA/LrgA family protein [Chitinibacter tainanensis]|uniref:CidA/LrgA family protein n=1 Tax=Chitinibacter tainanensis TaxID=230667 RepID=UPI0023569B3B|nr:CidA/LrgA family protein [Chitinibacter tainanensis]
MLYGITIIFATLFAGEALSRLLQLPIPGAVMGMLLLTLIAILRRGLDRRVVDAAGAMLRYLGVLFIPAGVGLMTLGDEIGRQGWALLATLLISTVMTMAGTAWMLQHLLRRKDRLNKNAIQDELP